MDSPELPILIGLGHPDQICDSIANEISVSLCQEYMKRVGVILHHNIDKSLLAAGEAETRFGGGLVKKPMLLVIGDRATFAAGDVKFPIEQIVISTAKRWFRTNLRFVNPTQHVRYQVELKPGSAALTDIFKRRGKILGANDTSAAVGWAPMSRTEKLVLETERFLNSRSFKRDFPESGEDVKVMGCRVGKRVSLTVAMAFVDRFIDSESAYFRSKAAVLERLKGFLQERTDLSLDVYLNTLDRPGRGIGGMYLTVLGTCADGADCGQVGRGNGVNGVISLNRPKTSEAAAGKQPVCHPGKVYNVLTHQLADRIHTQVAGVREVYVWLCSQIGKPIDQPLITSIQITLERGIALRSVSPQIREIVDRELENMDKFIQDLARGKFAVC